MKHNRQIPGVTTRVRWPLRLSSLLLVASATIAEGQSIPNAPERLAGVTAWADTLEREKRRLRQQTVELPGKDERSVVRFFTRGDELRKLEVTTYADTGRTTGHFYMRDGTLLLVVLRESAYDGNRREQVSSRRAEFFWFAGDTLLYRMDPTGAAQPGTDPAAAGRAADVRAEFERLLALRPR